MCLFYEGLIDNMIKKKKKKLLFSCIFYSILSIPKVISIEGRLISLTIRNKNYAVIILVEPTLTNSHPLYFIVNCKMPAPFSISCGAPQGSVLYLSLFLFFMNDLLHFTSPFSC